MKRKCIYVALAIGLGVILDAAGVSVDDWQYWGILVCSFGLYLCGVTQ